MRKYISFAMPVTVTNQGVTFYFQERKEEGELNGKLEFPGGKIEPGEKYASFFANIYARFGDETKVNYYRKYLK